MFKYLIIAICLPFVFLTNILAQETALSTDSLELKDPSSIPDILVIQAQVKGERILINWFPTRPKTWKTLMQNGYTITRTEVDNSGNPIGSPITISEKTILPKDSLWMATKKRMADGLLEPIMALMYDSTFVFPKNDFYDETNMKYNYIVYETTRKNNIARAIGLGIVDSTAQLGKSYKYFIKGIGSELEGEITLEMNKNRFAQNPRTNPIKFTFPNDMALSDMLAKARPKELNIIQVIAKPYGDSIVVRWGPNNARLWQSAMKDGYDIYRTGGGDDSLKLLAKIHPWPKAAITEAIAHDSIAMMAAGILYNDESVKVVDEDAGLFDKASDFDNEFGFALFAAERSGLAADILGFRYVDKTVEPDSGYTYFIGTEVIEKSLYWAKVGLLNVFVKDPMPVDLRIESKDKVIKLVWSKEANEKNFSSYNLKRSEDGINFLSLTSAPLVFGETDRVPLKEFSYNDSVGVNNKDFYYKLVGMNSFGEMSEEAIVAGKAYDLTPPHAVNIQSATFSDSLQQFTIKWQSMLKQPGDFSNYSVLMSDQPNGLYSGVSHPIPLDSTEFIFKVGDLDIDRAFYFKVQSQDTSGNTVMSMNKNANVPDLIAPEAPAVLTGIIDSTGQVKVAWEHSIAKDVQGYWLYWGNDSTQEMSLVNEDILSVNSHSWYVADVSLNEKIYFCVRAEDDAFNKGFASQIIEVSRPDKVPPISPFMLKAEPIDGQLKVSWQLSGSEDVMGQVLYKRPVSPTDTIWQLIDTLSIDQDNYVDAKIFIDQQYQYCIKTFDDADNVSEFSNIKTANVPFPFEQVVIDNLNVEFQKKKENKSNNISWEYIPFIEQLNDKPFSFNIYRAVGGKNPKYLNTISSDKRNFEDAQVVAGVLYNYSVQIHFDNGWIGDMCDIKSILVK